MLSEFLDRLIAFAAKDEAALVAAREDWWKRAGKVLDDDPLYEERSTAFLEWFALERRGPDGRVPVERFLAEGRLNDLEGRWAFACHRSHRSLFELVEIQKGHMIVDDLLGGARFEVTERRNMPGFAVGELFEARLVANIVDPPSLLFSRAFQFHPRDAAKEIRKAAERARERGEQREETLFRMARLRLKTTRYQHVSPARIYSADEE
jgi:hypothetical protein